MNSKAVKRKNMKRAIIIIGLVIFIIIVSLVVWQLYENNEIMFAKIFGIAGIVSVILGIYALFNGKDIKNQTAEKREKDNEKIKATDATIGDLIEIIKQKNEKIELLESKNVHNLYGAEIRKIKEEVRQLKEELANERKLRREIEKQLEQDEKIITQNEEKILKTKSSLYKEAFRLFLKNDNAKALNLLFCAMGHPKKLPAPSAHRFV